MPGEIIEIESPHMLWSIYSSQKKSGTYFKLPVITDETIRKGWEIRLNKYYGACGCETGSIGLKLGVGLTVILALVGYYLGGVEFLKSLWYLIPVTILLGGILGKIIGLKTARSNLYKTISSMEILLADNTLTQKFT